MLSIDQNRKIETTSPKSDMENFNDIASNLIGALSEKNKHEYEVDRKRLELSERDLIHNQSIFKYKFWLLAIGLISLISISTGLIFYVKDSSLGMSILSHIGAIIGGVLAGVGYGSNKNS